MSAPSRSARVPSLCLHRATGQAVVRLNGRDHYLGRFGSDASRVAYERLIAHWLSAGRTVPPQSTSAPYLVADLIRDFLEWAEHEYRKSDGTLSREVLNLRLALRVLYKLFRDVPALSFGPKALMAYRDESVRLGLARRTVNQRVGIVKRCFRWATREERTPASVYHGLLSVEGLKRGRCSAREGDGVKPVPESDIERTLLQLSPIVRAMVEVQLFTGMRPGEVVQMRPGDIDRGGRVWIYRPADHKNSWRGHSREVPIGPRAQRVLEPFMLRSADRYCFSPEEAVAHRHRVDRADRRTPLWPSHLEALEASRKPEPLRRPSEFYSVLSYGRAIARGCARAHVAPWGPGRLRHNAATRIRAEFGLEAAGAILGHRILETTQVYAEVNRSRALEVAERVG